MADSEPCARCGRAYAAVMVTCPFCGTLRAASVPPPAPARTPPTFDFPALADQAIELHRPILPLEYHSAALLALDALLELNYGPQGAAELDGTWKPGPGTLKALTALGSLAGEIVRRQWGGTWELDPDQPEQILLARLVLTSGEPVYPLSQLYRRARLGATHGLHDWGERIRRHLGMGEGDAAAWLRYARTFEARGRIDFAKQFYVVAARIDHDPVWISRASALEERARNESARAARIAESKLAIEKWIAEGERLLSGRGARIDTGCMTLTAVDFLMRDIYGAEPVARDVRERHCGTERALGAFVGSVLCRRFRAEWVPDADRPPHEWSVGWDAGERAQPFGMVSARIERGAGALVLGQVAAAIKAPCARGACVDPPEVGSAWAEQAQRFARTERYDWAVEFGRMALAYGADGPDHRFSMAQWLSNVGRFDEAAEHVTEGLERDDRRADGWEIRAAVMAALGNDDRAKEAAAIARTMRDRPWEKIPPRKVPLEEMMAAAAELTEPSRALVAYAMVNEAYPECAEAWRERGVAHALLRQPDNALKCFDRAIALEPQVPQGHDHRAALLGQLGRWEEAFSTLETGLAVCPGSKTLLQRKGIYCSMNRRKAEAVAMFDQVLRLFPDDPHTLKLRGEALAKDR